MKILNSAYLNVCLHLNYFPRYSYLLDIGASSIVLVTKTTIDNKQLYKTELKKKKKKKKKKGKQKFEELNTQSKFILLQIFRRSISIVSLISSSLLFLSSKLFFLYHLFLSNFSFYCKCKYQIWC